MALQHKAQLVTVGASVHVVREACDHVAVWIASENIPLDREESSLPEFSPPEIGNFFLALVAICHQTSPRGLPPLEGTIGGIRRRGWDYLFARLEQATASDPELLTPERWSRFSSLDIEILFCEQALGLRLTDPEGRAELLRDLGIQMIAKGWRVADDLYRHCKHRIAEGSPNLLDTLATFRAYDDPVRKKSYFFLALMRNSDLWRYPDPENLGPPVDYHETRGHLRLGTVRISDPTLYQKVCSGQVVSASEDIAIRQAVHDAIMYISRQSGLNNPSQLHYLFWNLFRSICTRDAPQCFATRPGFTLPERYSALLMENGKRRCPFAQFCPSAGVPSPIAEHVFHTDYY